MRNITPSTPQPGRAGQPSPRQTATAARPNVVRIAVVVIALMIVFALGRMLFGHHENTYEKRAGAITTAIQNNDMSPVEKDFNAETRTRFSRLAVAHASDILTPLGKVKTVKETTPSDAPARTHFFDVAGERGSVRERMVLDPDGKVFSFDYKAVVPNTK